MKESNPKYFLHMKWGPSREHTKRLIKNIYLCFTAVLWLRVFCLGSFGPCWGASRALAWNEASGSVSRFLKFFSLTCRAHPAVVLQHPSLQCSCREGACMNSPFCSGHHFSNKILLHIASRETGIEPADI